MQAIKGAVKRYMAENLSDRAAALTYYSVLSLFPALIAVIALAPCFRQVSVNHGQDPADHRDGRTIYCG